MNERIQELVRESNLDMYGLGKERHRWEYTVEKFAELIVQECMEQIDRIRDGCEDDGEDQQALGADWAGLAVARHFGVEK